MLDTGLETRGVIVSNISYVICSHETHSRVGKMEINQVVIQMSP